MNGKAIIFSAPSGSGKTTIVKHLLNTFPDNLAFSISATTRRKREGVEQDGEDYFFLSQEEFQDNIENNQLVEWEEVYKGTCYGTLKSEIENIWRAGKAVIFDVDVKGGLNLKEYFGNDALAIFVKVPDFETLKERLKKRQTETEEELLKRLEKVHAEMAYESGFDKTIVNKDLKVSFHHAEQLLNSFLALN